MIKVLDNVYDLVTLNMEQRFSERVALRFYDKETDEVTAVHYKDYARDIRRAVSYFQSTIPDIKGKKICLLNKNCYEYAVNTFGIILAGGVLVLLNQHKSWDELSYELGLVDPAAILTDGDDYGTKEQLQAAYGSILRPMDGFRAYEPVAEMPRCIGHDDLMILMFTSGTTGRSKGVMLSERNFFSVMRAHVQIGERMMEYKHDPELVVSQYTVLPMFHLGAFICLFSWAHGGWALNISGDIRNFYKEIRRMPSQVMAVVPVIMNSLHKDVMRGRKERLGELWVPICSSAMFDPQVMLDMATNGMFVVQTYGATETCGDGIINYAQDAKHIGAVGQGNDYLDYKLEPDGELCIRGDSIMLGYYKDPEATAAVIDKDGWFHTGDLARVDEDGYYYITGRKKNLIILDSGENLSPEELEGMLEKCPAVQECIVKELGKKIGVVVYCEKEHQQTVRDFIAQMNRTVPLYKRIGVVEFSETPLPRNGAGKLVRKYYETERKHNTMERAEIISQITAILEDVAEVSPEDVTESSVLMDDLDLSSMEILTIVADLEETFGLRIPEKELRNFVTMGDLVDYLAANVG